ncbi:MAG: pyrroline-5-carboxylate reductase [Christensenellaceae bacterium]|nr:pyrroline-5-carboxylate reductase [Christensenellaceae bacterium]
MKRVGLIGAGNMGSAILRGMLAADYLRPTDVAVCDVSRRKLEELSRELPSVTYVDSAQELTSLCQMIILAVKPNYLRGVIDDIRGALHGKAVISIAAGWTVEMLEDALEGTDATCLRVMPNTPAMVGEGMTAICDNSTFSKEDFAFAKGIFDACGRTVILPERLFDGVIAISGSSPAYVFMMIEAMADAGVKEGLPRACAYEMAAQALLGSALMVLQSGTHPASLKDAVCSPGGTTIEAVEMLERRGFRAAIMDAMGACAEKSRIMSKQ